MEEVPARRYRRQSHLRDGAAASPAWGRWTDAALDDAVKGPNEIASEPKPINPITAANLEQPDVATSRAHKIRIDRAVN